jgi:hypothetical protein
MVRLYGVAGAGDEIMGFVNGRGVSAPHRLRQAGW